MTYATQQSLSDRFGAVELAQLTDRTNGTVIDAVVVGRALADADAEVDSYLATRYQLPLASVPPVLERIASDIARYRLFEDSATDTVRTRYEDAVKVLKSMGKGDVSLPAATLLPATTTGGGNSVKVSAPDRVFSADTLAGY